MIFKFPRVCIFKISVLESFINVKWFFDSLRCAFWRGQYCTYENVMSRMDESCHTYEWVMSRIWMNHLTCGNIPEGLWQQQRGHEYVSCRTYEWVMSHKRWVMSQGHVYVSCRTYEWGMSHKRWVMSQIWINHVPCAHTDVLQQQQQSHRYESCHTKKNESCHVQMSQSTHMNGSFHMCTNRGSVAAATHAGVCVGARVAPPPHSCSYKIHTHSYTYNTFVNTHICIYIYIYIYIHTYICIHVHTYVYTYT